MLERPDVSLYFCFFPLLPQLMGARVDSEYDTQRVPLLYHQHRPVFLEVIIMCGLFGKFPHPLLHPTEILILTLPFFPLPRNESPFTFGCQKGVLSLEY